MPTRKETLPATSASLPEHRAAPTDTRMALRDPSSTFGVHCIGRSDVKLGACAWAGEGRRSHCGRRDQRLGGIRVRRSTAESGPPTRQVRATLLHTWGSRDTREKFIWMDTTGQLNQDSRQQRRCTCGRHFLLCLPPTQLPGSRACRPTRLRHRPYRPPVANARQESDRLVTQQGHASIPPKQKHQRKYLTAVKCLHAEYFVARPGPTSSRLEKTYRDQSSGRLGGRSARRGCER